MANILATKIGKEAYAKQFNIPLDHLDSEDTGYSMLSAIDNFYSETIDSMDMNNDIYNKTY